MNIFTMYETTAAELNKFFSVNHADEAIRISEANNTLLATKNGTCVTFDDIKGLLAEYCHCNSVTEVVVSDGKVLIMSDK